MALALAHWFHAEIHVVRVESRRFEAGAGDDAVCARVDAFVAAANVDASPVETVILTGDPVDALVEYSHSIPEAQIACAGQGVELV
jgi:hypothetical protein